MVITITITLAALSFSSIFSYVITDKTLTNSGFLPIQTHGQGANIVDAKGDTKLVSLYQTDIVPQLKGYHDILSSQVTKLDDGKLQLTLDIAGDANQNVKYETVYLWLIYYSTPLADTYSIDSKRVSLYTIFIPNFGIGSNFGSIGEGWYIAIFNNTNGAFSLPLSKIPNMPKDKVQIYVDAAFIGNPSTFKYIVSAMIRVNNTFLDKAPDYIVDSVPDNYEPFWIQWFH